MKHQKLLAIAFTCLVVAAWTQDVHPQSARGTIAQADESTLDETLKRLEKNLTRHGSKPVGGIIRRFDARDFRGCKIVYELTPVLAPDHKGYVPFTERTAIDLSILDSESVEVRRGRKGRASVRFAARDGVSPVEFSLADESPKFGKAARFRSYYLAVTNVAAAEDVRDDLVRAIELCNQ